MAERHRGFNRDFEGGEGGGGGDRGGPRGGGGSGSGSGGGFRGGGGGGFRGGGFGGGGRPGGFGGGGRPGGGFRDRDRGFSGPPRDRGFSGPPRAPRPEPVYREGRPPAPPVEASEFQDVDSDLAIALLDTATRLTEIVGTAGLPEEQEGRRQAVIETFETIYFSILEAVTGGEDEEEDTDTSEDPTAEGE